MRISLNVFVFEALPDGEPRAKATELEHEIAMVWNGMTDSEKMEATTDAIEELKEHRANKSIAVHNVPISAFHDTHVTLDKIASEVRNFTRLTLCLTFFVIAFQSCCKDRREEPPYSCAQ